jgi:hypothetical protein
VTVIRLIEVLQRIIWIDLLNDFGLFTLQQGLAIGKVLRPAGNFGLRGGIGRVYAPAHGYCAADADDGQTDQERASGKVGVSHIRCLVLEINAHRSPPKLIIGRTLAPEVGEINTFDLDDIDDHALQGVGIPPDCCEIDDPPCAPAKGPDRVMNGSKATSALSPFDSQLRTLVGAARGSHSCHKLTHARSNQRPLQTCVFAARIISAWIAS